MIEQIIITSLLINFIHFVMNDSDMIFYNVGQWLTKNITDYINKPLFACVTCMASIWGTLAYLYFFDFQVIEWLIFIGSVAATNGIILKLRT